MAANLAGATAGKVTKPEMADFFKNIEQFHKKLKNLRKVLLEIFEYQRFFQLNYGRDGTCERPQSYICIYNERSSTFLKYIFVVDLIERINEILQKAGKPIRTVQKAKGFKVVGSKRTVEIPRAEMAETVPDYKKCFLTCDISNMTFTSGKIFMLNEIENQLNILAQKDFLLKQYCFLFFLKQRLVDLGLPHEWFMMKIPIDPHHNEPIRPTRAITVTMSGMDKPFRQPLFKYHLPTNEVREKACQQISLLEEMLYPERQNQENKDYDVDEDYEAVHYFPARQIISENIANIQDEAGPSGIRNSNGAVGPGPSFISSEEPSLITNRGISEDSSSAQEGVRAIKKPVSVLESYLELKKSEISPAKYTLNPEIISLINTPIISTALSSLNNSGDIIHSMNFKGIKPNDCDLLLEFELFTPQEEKEHVLDVLRDEMRLAMKNINKHRRSDVEVAGDDFTKLKASLEPKSSFSEGHSPNSSESTSWGSSELSATSYQAAKSSPVRPPGRYFLCA